jgi:hypothetical protein
MELGRALDAALASSAAPAVAMVSSGETPFTQVPQGRQAEFSKAAAKVWDVLHTHWWMWKGNDIDVTDRWLEEKCRFGRRNVQKGLWFLQHTMGLIYRHRHGGGRTITRLIKWPRKAKKVAVKSEQKPHGDPGSASMPPREDPGRILKRLRSAGWDVQAREGPGVFLSPFPEHENAASPTEARHIIKGHEIDIRAYIDATRPARE